MAITEHEQTSVSAPVRVIEQTPPDPIKELLQRAHDLIAGEKGWCQGSEVAVEPLDERFHITDEEDPGDWWIAEDISAIPDNMMKAYAQGSFCAIGSIQFEARSMGLQSLDIRSAYNRVAACLGEDYFPEKMSIDRIVAFNDAEVVTKEEVLALFRKAINSV